MSHDFEMCSDLGVININDTYFNYYFQNNRLGKELLKEYLHKTLNTTLPLMMKD